MATTTASSFSSLVLLAAAILAVVHLPLPAHAFDYFQNCTDRQDVYIVRVSSLETQPKPAKIDSDFTVNIVAETGDLRINNVGEVSAVYEIFAADPPAAAVPLFRTQKTVCDGEDTCPGVVQEFAVDHTFPFPSTIDVPSKYQLRVSLIGKNDPSSEPLTCIKSTFTLE